MVMTIGRMKILLVIDLLHKCSYRWNRLHGLGRMTPFLVLRLRNHKRSDGEGRASHRYFSPSGSESLSP
jgi:hypothetical protein